MLTQIRITFRFIKLITLLLLAVVYIPLFFLTPIKASKAGHRLLRHKVLNASLKVLLGILKVRTEVHGTPMVHAGAYISNHVSWLDVPLMGCIRFSIFVAKDDVESWPIVGTITKRIGTIFINRANKFSTYRCLPRVEEKIRQDQQVVFFPEGTTSSGQDTLTFYPMFFETISRTQSCIQPVVIRYERADGTYCHSVPFVDDMTFLSSLFQILSEPEIIAHITYMPPIPAANQHRQELCKMTKEVIDNELQNQLKTAQHQAIDLQTRQA